MIRYFLSMLRAQILCNPSFKFLKDIGYFVKHWWSVHSCWKFEWIPREANGMAHSIANWCKREGLLGSIAVSDIPPDIVTWDSVCNECLVVKKKKKDTLISKSEDN